MKLKVLMDDKQQLFKINIHVQLIVIFTYSPQILPRGLGNTNLTIGPSLGPELLHLSNSSDLKIYFLRTETTKWTQCLARYTLLSRLDIVYLILSRRPKACVGYSCSLFLFTFYSNIHSSIKLMSIFKKNILITLFHTTFIHTLIQKLKVNEPEVLN